MKLHGQTGDRKYLDAVEKSFDYYKNIFDTEPNQRSCPWQIQAWALAFDTTAKRKYADFVLQMADYLVTFQADEAADVYPDMVGGFVSDEGVGGVGSAAYLEGMAEACRIARKVGDAKRAEQYAHVLLLGARLIDQLIFKEPEAFYCVTKKEVVGGVKMSPMDHSIRIDNCQHAVLALMGIRQMLFPPPSSQPGPRR